jgi:hypothetical protein
MSEHCRIGPEDARYDWMNPPLSDGKDVKGVLAITAAPGAAAAFVVAGEILFGGEASKLERFADEFVDFILNAIHGLLGFEKRQGHRILDQKGALAVEFLEFFVGDGLAGMLPGLEKAAFFRDMAVLDLGVFIAEEALHVFA